MEYQHTLLFVDDEPSILNALCRLFHWEGYQLLTAESGERGLQLLREREVSLVISDQRMPQMIGAEFLGHARTVSPHSIRIMLTGYSDIDAAKQAINEGGIYRYITKPWNDEQLKTIVHEALERYDLEESNRRLTLELQRKNAELEQFNARLEQRVEERTRELRTAYEQNLALTRRLELKVRELEGKDRIAQHLLNVHSLEETLELILQVISDVMRIDTAIIYLKEDGLFRPAASIGVSADRTMAAPDDQLARSPITSAQRQAFQAVEATQQPLKIEDPERSGTPTFAVVPVLREDELIGLVQVGNHPAGSPITDEELQTLASFALQAAVAINDAQIHRNFGKWQEQLDDIIDDVEELDRW